MLIKCPECGKDISDKAKQCINCGYPIINMNNNCIINNKEYDITQELQMILNNDGVANVIRSLRMKCNLSLTDAKKLYDIINETKVIPDNFQCDTITNVSNNNTPKCPKCSSTNIQLVKRKWSPLMGFMTNKVDRICVNCKHKF